MELLSKDQILWARFLAKEPTKKKRRRRDVYHGCLFYFIMCRKYPVQCLVEILACALIFGLMFGMLYLLEIAAWIERMVK